MIDTFTKYSEMSKTGWSVSSVHLDSDLLQEEVDSPVDVSIAVVKGHHTLILIFACNLHELGHRHKQMQCNQTLVDIKQNTQSVKGTKDGNQEHQA